MNSELERLLSYAFRLRIVFALIGAGASWLFLSTVALEYNTVKMDYLAWAIFAAVTVVSFTELWKFGRSYGIASTLTLDFVALALAVIGRISSIVASMWVSGLTFALVGGGINGEQGIVCAAWLLPASMVCLWASFVHSVLRRPVSFGRAATYAELFASAQSRLSSAWSFAFRHPVAFSFAIGVAVRAIPELIWWSQLIGWDTVYYVANLDDFLLNPNPFAPQYIYGSYRNTPPMLDMVLSIPAIIMGSWTTYKVFPPVAFGIMAALVALVSSKVLKLEGKWALLSGTLAALFILDLRISWDYQKQMVGTLFLLGFLSISGKANEGGNRRGTALAALLLVLSALSSEVTALASFLASGYLLAKHALSKKRLDSLAFAATLLCSTALLVWYAGGPVYSNAYLGAAPVGLVANFSDAKEVIPYFLAGFGAVLPLAIAGLKKTNWVYRAVTLGLILAAVSPLVVPYTSVTTWYRFLIQLAPISVPLAVAAMSKIGSRGAVVAVLFLIAVPGIAYISPNGIVYTYQLTSSIREFPAYMAPSASNFEALLEGGQAAAGFVKNGSLPVAAYVEESRFIHLFVRNPDPYKLIHLNSLDGFTMNYTMSRLGVNEVLLMSVRSLESVNSSLASFSYAGKIYAFNLTQVWKGEKGCSIYLVTKAQ